MQYIILKIEKQPTSIDFSVKQGNQKIDIASLIIRISCCFLMCQYS